MLVESSLVPAWLAALANGLAGSGSVDLKVFVVGQQRTPLSRPLLLRLYERMDARLFRCRPEACDEVPIAADGAPTSGGLEGYDVVLDFASHRPEKLVAGTRYGVWVLTHGPTGAGLYETRIDALLEDGARAEVYRSYGAIDPVSPHRTKNQALWKAKGAVAHRLETVRRLGSAYVDLHTHSEGSGGVEAPRRPSSNRAVATRAGRTVVGIVERRVRRARAREAWIIAARARAGPPLAIVDSVSTKGFSPIQWSSRASFADPFVFDDEDDTYVFFEERRAGAGKAHISYVRLDAQARPSILVTPALVRPYHVSYPFVFRHGGEVFMILESSANRTVELYRASSFPSTWELESVLLDRVIAVDPTLLAEEARLWLFAGVAEEGAALNDELHLYSAATLAGPWEPHPANPVVSDVRSARPAGRIFRQDGNLIRPSQDCSRRYGYALVFNRIDVLTDDDYRETPVGRLEPTWYPDLVATHTYNFGEKVEVIDGKRVTARRPFSFGR
jgi:hypothetical protein